MDSIAILVMLFGVSVGVSVDLLLYHFLSVSTYMTFDISCPYNLTIVILQWKLSATTISIIKVITYDLFRDVF